MSLPSEVKVYQQTKFRPDVSFGGWDISTSGFEIQTSAILEFYFPKNSPKRGVNRQFQAKTSKSLHRNISDELAIWSRNSDHETHFVGGRPLPQSKYSMADGRHRENRYDVIFQRRMFRIYLNEIRQPDAEWHADYGEMVEVETRSRIPIWRTFVFRKRK